MSATFYPAKQESENAAWSREDLNLRFEGLVWSFVEVPYEVNLSNSNARLVLSDLGLNPDFENADTKEQEIDDFIERCHQVLCGHVPEDGDPALHLTREERYVLHKAPMLLVSAALGKQNGATHWYFA